MTLHRAGFTRGLNIGIPSESNEKNLEKNKVLGFSEVLPDSEFALTKIGRIYFKNK